MVAGGSAEPRVSFRLRAANCGFSDGYAAAPSASRTEGDATGEVGATSCSRVEACALATHVTEAAHAGAASPGKLPAGRTLTAAGAAASSPNAADRVVGALRAVFD